MATRKTKKAARAAKTKTPEATAPQTASTQGAAVTGATTAPTATEARKVSIKEKVAGLFNESGIELSTAQVLEKLPGLNPNSIRFMITQLRQEGRLAEARREGHMSVLKAGSGTPARIMNVRSRRASSISDDQELVEKATEVLEALESIDLGVLSSLVKRHQKVASAFAFKN